MTHSRPRVSLPGLVCLFPYKKNQQTLYWDQINWGNTIYKKGRRKEKDNMLLSYELPTRGIKSWMEQLLLHVLRPAMMLATLAVFKE